MAATVNMNSMQENLGEGPEENEQSPKWLSIINKDNVKSFESCNGFSVCTIGQGYHP